MKLLVLEPQPEFGGGMEGVSVRLAKELARRGDAIVLVYDAEGDMLPLYRSFAHETVRIPLNGFRKKDPIGTARLVLALDRIVRSHGIEACYTSHLGYLTIGALLKMLNGRAWHYHLGLPGTGRSWADRLALPLLGSGISPAKHTLDTWRAVGWPTETLHEVRNWVDGDDFCPPGDRDALRRSLGIAADAFVIGFVGRLVTEKGVEVLVDAFNDLPIDEAVLVMVGRGEPAVVEALQRRCARPGLIIRPRTARPQDIYGAADVACVPSIWPEPFPLVVLESMASGTPVICSDVGILPSILGTEFSDLVAAYGSVQSLIDRLMHVYANLGDPKRANAMRQHALSHYGAEDSVTQYRRIFLETITSQARA